MASTVRELQWITYMLQDFQVPLQLPIPFFWDSKAALDITANPVFHERTKHIEIDCHVVRDKYKDGFILPQHVSSSQELADIFTKSLPVASFSYILSKLSLWNAQLEEGVLNSSEASEEAVSVSEEAASSSRQNVIQNQEAASVARGQVVQHQTTHGRMIHQEGCYDPAWQNPSRNIIPPSHQSSQFKVP